MGERAYGIKEQEIANAALREVTALQRDAALASTTKRYGDTLKHVLPRMPSESANCQLILIRSKICLPCARSRTTSKPS